MVLIEKLITSIKSESSYCNFISLVEKPKIFLEFREATNGILSSDDATYLIPLLQDNDLQWGVINLLKCMDSIPFELEDVLFNVLYRFQGNTVYNNYFLPTLSRLLSFPYVEKRLQEDFKKGLSWMHRYAVIISLVHNSLPLADFQMSKENGIITDGVISNYRWDNEKNTFISEYKCSNFESTIKIIEELYTERYNLLANTYLNNDDLPYYMLEVLHLYLNKKDLSFPNELVNRRFIDAQKKKEARLIRK